MGSRAVAFLMSIYSVFFVIMSDTHDCYYNTDYSHDDTDNPDNNTQHHLSLSFLFSTYVSPPKIREVLKMYSFRRKVNRLPFWQHPSFMLSPRKLPIPFPHQISQILKSAFYNHSGDQPWLFLFYEPFTRLLHQTDSLAL